MEKKQTKDLRVRKLDIKVHSFLKIEAVKRGLTLEDFLKYVLSEVVKDMEAGTWNN